MNVIKHRKSNYLSFLTIVLSFFMLSLNGCGFKLRGYEHNNINTIAKTKPVMVNDIAIEKDTITRKLIFNLKEGIKSNSIVLTDNKNDYMLELTYANYEKQTISTGSNKLTTQYKISLQVIFNIYYKNKLILEQQIINAGQNYNYVPDQILGLSNEENNITNELIKEVVDRMVTQIIIVQNNEAKQ